MIVLKNVNKIYEQKDRAIHAVKGINLHVKKGEIMGIIGYSGAGKSSLIRCLNLLEVPTSGEVIVDEKNLVDLTEQQLREMRKEIGMIFQHFNLFRSKSVFKNIAFPLKKSGLSKEEINKRVYELLNLVGLEDKINSYPSQLSGGQKQRVAIARALANNPKVLLCDEATSALDPETTLSILSLLKEINQKLGLTIVLITHQMDVIKEICHRVAVMENGEVVEEGDIVRIFSNPQEGITKRFISSLFNYEKINKFLEENPYISELKSGEKIVKLSYIGTNTEGAYISEITRKFNIDASILFGNIEIINNTLIGNLVVKLHGEKNNIEKAIEFLTSNEIIIEVLKEDKNK